MAKVKPPAAWEHTHYVPWLQRDVDPGQTVDVPDEDVPSYLEGGWTEVKAAEPRTKVKES